MSLALFLFVKKGELEISPTCKNFLQVCNEGTRIVNRMQKIYNLDVIISVGYRVKSQRGIQFRQWANRVLKEYLLKGYSVNQRLEKLEQRVSETIFDSSHDRFLIIDDEVYHIGASIKDLGKKWFAFCRMQLQASDILHKLETTKK